MLSTNGFFRIDAKKRAVCLKRAVQVAVQNMIIAEVGHHSEADPVISQCPLDGDPGHPDSAQGFFF